MNNGDIMLNINEQIIEISSKEACEFLKPRHYAGRKPQISKAFGWYVDNELVAVCTLGKPASNCLCVGICGQEYSKNVYELNRLCRIDNLNLPLSHFVGQVLNICKDYNWIIVSYSDTGMHHNGYIYQATNFIYTGQTKERTDKYTEGNKHSRHYTNTEIELYRKVRTAKNRYVYFATHNKRLKKEWINHLNYEILPYPKAENKNYILGEYQKPIIINKKVV